MSKFKDIWEWAVGETPCAARTNIGYDPVEAFRLGAMEIIKEIATASNDMAGQAGVGGVETAGSVISYLAAHPAKIDLFMQRGVCGLFDDAPGGPRDLYAKGCLTWHRQGDGKVVTPQDLRIGLTVRDMTKRANSIAKS